MTRAGEDGAHVWAGLLPECFADGSGSRAVVERLRVVPLPERNGSEIHERECDVEAVGSEPGRSNGRCFVELAHRCVGLVRSRERGTQLVERARDQHVRRLESSSANLERACKQRLGPLVVAKERRAPTEPRQRLG